MSGDLLRIAAPRRLTRSNMMKREPRDIYYCIRVTKSELNSIKREAAHHGLSVAGYFRCCHQLLRNLEAETRKEQPAL